MRYSKQFEKWFDKQAKEVYIPANIRPETLKVFKESIILGWTAAEQFFIPMLEEAERTLSFYEDLDALDEQENSAAKAALAKISKMKGGE